MFVLLADFIGKSRLAHYSLDPLPYFTVPGLVWDAALKMPRIDLELKDVDMNNFVENSLRGEISTISIRYARAKDPTLPAHDANLPNQNLGYLDANNLYE